MDLNEYMIKNGMTVKDISEKCKLSKVTVYSMLRKSKKPTVNTAKKIVILTNGEVGFHDILGDSVLR